MYKEKVIQEMKIIFQDDPSAVEHTLNVLQYAEDIMEEEKIKEDERELISITAILHDIGIVETQRKYGSTDFDVQEIECPIVARKILEKIHYDPKKIDRICYIIANHHTPAKIDAMDFQIQWEADLLENLKKLNKETEQEKLKELIDMNFKTARGKELACDNFIIS